MEAARLGDGPLQGVGGNYHPVMVGPWEMASEALPATVKLKAMVAQQGAVSSRGERWLEAARRSSRWISWEGAN
ncbi:hypothetical protein E2562_035251 [Oryza meyeriana var. granulata]|uniref:Uncharacterized protein n=1 Tax=Oryza meyeriana var. granulata TaxID=110450 RepID=A0A6G1CKY2_9ORYZ|nr:hypothetical protein E2562_035251 [Oryza meyeriana var. granulata]